MVYYSRRSWRGLFSEVFIGQEGKFVSINDMSEKEFREFILWRLGLGMPAAAVAEMRKSIIEACLKGEYGTQILETFLSIAKKEQNLKIGKNKARPQCLK